MAGKTISRDTILRILDLARWAPSGDNTQPWRFQIVDDGYVIVHGHDTRDEILYDFDGHASHMAHGALLETMRIAASAEGLAMEWLASADDEWRKIEYHVRFTNSAETTADPLCAFIESRMVQRRPMSTRPLSDVQRDALIAAVGDGFVLQFFESFSQRRAVAKLLWDNAYIRLTCPEAFPVHQSIIEWGARFSKDRIPEQAVGVDPLTATLMRWVMKSWGRVDFFNRYLMGTLMPRVQLDYLPALRCAAHVLIRPKSDLRTIEDWVRQGQAMQRVWLTATQHGLHLQPEMTPVIFRWYARANRHFSAVDGFSKAAEDLSIGFEGLASASRDDQFGFFGRIGFGAAPKSRSIRLAIKDLMVN